jgi:hypothetical protein
MTPSLVSYATYVQFIYSLLDRSTIESHTLTAYTIGQTICGSRSAPHSQYRSKSRLLRSPAQPGDIALLLALV